MKNPVEKTYLIVAGWVALIGLAFLGVLAIWAAGILIGWNGFVSYAFHSPTINYWQAVAAIFFINFLLAPWYVMQQVKDTSKKPTA